MAEKQTPDDSSLSQAAGEKNGFALCRDAELFSVDRANV